jgi:hypothetical protein
LTQIISNRKSGDERYVASDYREQLRNEEKKKETQGLASIGKDSLALA